MFFVVASASVICMCALGGACAVFVVCVGGDFVLGVVCVCVWGCVWWVCVCVCVVHKCSPGGARDGMEAMLLACGPKISEEEAVCYSTALYTDMPQGMGVCGGGGGGGDWCVGFNLQTPTHNNTASHQNEQI